MLEQQYSKSVTIGPRKILHLLFLLNSPSTALYPWGTCFSACWPTFALMFSTLFSKRTYKQKSLQDGAFQSEQGCGRTPFTEHEHPFSPNTGARTQHYEIRTKHRTLNTRTLNTEHLATGPGSLVPGPWPLVPGPWSLIPGP